MGKLHSICCLRPVFQAEVYTVDHVSERVKEGIRDIDSRVTRISQTATRIGDRLQVGYYAVAISNHLGHAPVTQQTQYVKACSRPPSGVHYHILGYNNGASTLLMGVAAVPRRHMCISKRPILHCSNCHKTKGCVHKLLCGSNNVHATALHVMFFMQTADGLRSRCLEAQELIAHLQAFSCHTAGEDDFSKLPALFTNEATLMEAAVSHCMHAAGLYISFTEVWQDSLHSATSLTNGAGC